MRRITIVVALLGMVVMNTAIASQATEKSIRELMSLTGSGDLGMQIMNNMVVSLKQIKPEIPDSFWEGIVKEVNAIIPVYQKYYSEEDLREVIEFYRTPAGQRLIQVQPHVFQESWQVGQEWGRQVAERVLEKSKAYENKSK
jgi:hypothetical protein